MPTAAALNTTRRRMPSRTIPNAEISHNAFNSTKARTAPKIRYRRMTLNLISGDGLIGEKSVAFVRGPSPPTPFLVHLTVVGLEIEATYR